MKKIFFIPFIFFIVLPIISKAQSLSWVQDFNPAGLGNFFLDKSNNICIVGGFTGTVDLDQGPNIYNVTAVGASNMFLLKEDAAGNFKWAKHFDGSFSPNALLGCHGIANDSNGNIFLYGSFVGSFDFDPGVGTFYMNTPSTINYVNTYLLKLDSTGNFIWAKQFTGANGGIAGGIGDRDMKLDASGNIYLLSAFGGSIDVDPGPNVVNLTSVATNAMLIEKLDNNGNYQWVKQIGVVGGISFALDSSRNIYIAGGFDSTADFDPSPAIVSLTPNGLTDFFVEKLDSSGNFLWVKQIGSTGTDIPHGMCVDKNRNVLVTGYFAGTVDFDPGPAIHNLSTTSSAAHFLLKLTTNGNYSWANTVGPRNGRSVTTDSLCNVYTTGETTGGDFDPGPGVYMLSSQGSSDVFVQKLDSSSNFIWAESFGSSAYDIPGLIALDHSNNIVISGVIGAGGQGGSGDFDPGLGVVYLGGTNAGFIEKLCVSPPPLNITVLKDTICIGDIAVLSVESIQGATYIWGKDGSPITNSNNDTLLVTQPGDYTVNVYGVGCPYDSDTVHVSVFPVITPTIQIASSPFSVPAGQQVTVHATVNATGGYPYTINWYNHGVLFATTTTDVVSYIKPIGKDSLSAVIKVNTPCTSPVSSNLIFVTGIDNNLVRDNFSITPNPASDKVYIQSQQLGNLEIIDMMGRVVFQIPIVNTQTTVDLNTLSDGLYIYRFFAQDGTLIQDKLLLMR